MQAELTKHLRISSDEARSRGGSSIVSRRQRLSFSKGKDLVKHRQEIHVE